MGSSGDNGAATSAQLNYPSGVAVDRFENIYVADVNNNKIRMVSSTGIITIFAGTGQTGNNGDYYAATDAQLNQPQAIAVDVTGENVYIADTNNGKIRVVATNSGIITTFAGTYGYSSYNYYDCPATNAQLAYPSSIAVDSVGNVYIGTGNQNGYGPNQVLVVAHATGIITLLAGCPYTCYNSYGSSATTVTINPPTGIAVDAHLNVYIATSYQYLSYNQILLVTHGTGIITVFAGASSGGSDHGDGPATSATLGSPSGIAVDVDGNVYISDQQNRVVRLVSNGTGIITTIAGGYNNWGPLGDNGAATDARLNSPRGLAVGMKGKGNLYIVDTNDYRIRKVASTYNYPTGQPSSHPSKFIWKKREVGVSHGYVRVLLVFLM